VKLIFAGTGSAFTVGDGNYHSNMILQSDCKKNLLIDCGSDARFSLYEQNLSYRDIHDVYISHLHANHIGGLEWLAFSTKFHNYCPKPYLHIHHQLCKNLWDKALSGSLNPFSERDINLSTFFQVIQFPKNKIIN
jgi:ribonuclease BN (tRNA processing enzyme)